MNLQAIALCLLVPVLRIGIELGQLKQAVNSLFLKVDASTTSGIKDDSQFWMYFTEVLPLFALILVAYLLYKSIASCSFSGMFKYVASGSLFNCMLIAIHWASDSSLLSLPMFLGGGNVIPQVIYAAGILQLSLAVGQLFRRKQSGSYKDGTIAKALVVLSAWSSTIILLSGKQGPLFVLALFTGGACSPL